MLESLLNWFLSEKKEGTREVRKRIRSVGNGFGDASKQQERAKRHDERRQAQLCYERGIEAPGHRAYRNCDGGGSGGREAGVAAELAEDDGAESEQRADRQVDACGQDDGRHHQSQQPYLYGYHSVRILAGLVRGDESVLPEGGFLDIPIVVVRKDNVQSFWDELKKLKG